MTHMFLCEAEATLNSPISVVHVNYIYAIFPPTLIGLFSVVGRTI